MDTWSGMAPLAVHLLIPGSDYGYKALSQRLFRQAFLSSNFFCNLRRTPLKVSREGREAMTCWRVVVLA